MGLFWLSDDTERLLHAWLIDGRRLFEAAVGDFHKLKTTLEFEARRQSEIQLGIDAKISALLKYTKATYHRTFPPGPLGVVLGLEILGGENMADKIPVTKVLLPALSSTSDVIRRHLKLLADGVVVSEESVDPSVATFEPTSLWLGDQGSAGRIELIDEDDSNGAVGPGNMSPVSALDFVFLDQTLPQQPGQIGVEFGEEIAEADVPPTPLPDVPPTPLPDVTPIA